MLKLKAVTGDRTEPEIMPAHVIDQAKARQTVASGTLFARAAIYGGVAFWS